MGRWTAEPLISCLPVLVNFSLSGSCFFIVTLFSRHYQTIILLILDLIAVKCFIMVPYIGPAIPLLFSTIGPILGTWLGSIYVTHMSHVLTRLLSKAFYCITFSAFANVLKLLMLVLTNLTLSSIYRTTAPQY